MGASPKKLSHKKGRSSFLHQLKPEHIFVLLVVLAVHYHIFASRRWTYLNSAPGATSASASLSAFLGGASLKETRRTDRLGDGCYHVFLDVGSNIGVHGRFLFEPHLYPQSKSSVKHFANLFGERRNNADLCVFAFEPNPKFRKRQLELSDAYAAMGWRYHPILAGASDRDGNMTFYHTFMVQDADELGFNAVAKKTIYGDPAKEITVPIVRLASWIEREIAGRKIPNRPHQQQGRTIPPKVAMKMDIEGLEYVVFPDLLLTGALCNHVDFLLGKFHHRSAFSNYFPMDRKEENNGLYIKDFGEARGYAQAMLRMVETSANCKTKYTLDDDESYHKDGMDFPKPPPS